MTETSSSDKVECADLAKFESSYLPLLKTQLANSLRKRDKAKERKVDKVLAAKRKEIEDNGGKIRLSGVGNRRGSGHRKRQRVVKRIRREKEDAWERRQQQQKQDVAKAE